VRRAPIVFFVIALVSGVAALNEGNLNHWGTTILLSLIALATAGAGIWTLRE
jgi:hypothetical protein